VANNTVQFFTAFNEMMNSSLVKMWKAVDSFLDKVYTTTRRTLNKIDNRIDQVASKVNSFSNSFQNLKTNLSDTKKVVQDSTSHLDKWKDKLNDLSKIQPPQIKPPATASAAGKATGNSGGGGGLLQSIAGSVAGLFSKGNLVSAASSVITSGMKQEKNIASLQPFVGKQGAAEAYSNIKKDAAATPFDTESLLQANKSLAKAGASASDARLDALALGNAVASMGGGNEQLTKMAELMGRIKTAGQAGSDDLKQFAEGGVDVYKALAAATGKSVEEAQNMNVSYDVLSSAFRKAGNEGGVFAGAMDNQNQMVEAKWSNLTENLQSGLGDVGVAFMPIIGKLLDFGLQLTNTLLPQIMQFVQPVMDMLNSLPIDTILNAIMSVVSAILAAVGPIMEQLQPLFATLFEVLTPLITQISEFIVSLVQQLAPILAVIAHIVAAVLGPALRIVGTIISWVITGISKAIDFIMPILQGIVDFISWIVDSVSWLFGAEDEHKKAKAMTPAPAPQAAREKATTVTATDAGAQANTGLAQTKVSVSTPQKNEAGKAAGEITSGGPRVININGVKFTDKIELHVLNAKEGLNELEARLEEMFLRILNSGAAIQ